MCICHFILIFIVLHSVCFSVGCDDNGCYLSSILFKKETNRINIKAFSFNLTQKIFKGLGSPDNIKNKKIHLVKPEDCIIGDFSTSTIISKNTYNKQHRLDFKEVISEFVYLLNESEYTYDININKANVSINKIFKFIQTFKKRMRYRCKEIQLKVVHANEENDDGKYITIFVDKVIHSDGSFESEGVFIEVPTSKNNVTISEVERGETAECSLKEFGLITEAEEFSAEAGFSVKEISKHLAECIKTSGYNPNTIVLILVIGIFVGNGVVILLIIVVVTRKSNKKDLEKNTNKYRNSKIYK